MNESVFLPDIFRVVCYNLQVCSGTLIVISQFAVSGWLANRGIGLFFETAKGVLYEQRIETRAICPDLLRVGYSRTARIPQASDIGLVWIQGGMMDTIHTILSWLIVGGCIGLVGTVGYLIGKTLSRRGRRRTRRRYRS